MHAALGHAMAGEADRLAHISKSSKGFAGDLVRPVARAWGHIAQEEWSAALEELSKILAVIERLPARTETRRAEAA